MRVPDWVNIQGWGTLYNVKRKELTREQQSDGVKTGNVDTPDDDYAPAYFKRKSESTEKSGPGSYRKSGTSSGKTPGEDKLGALIAFTNTWDLELLKAKKAIQEKHAENNVSADRNDGREQIKKDTASHISGSPLNAQEGRESKKESIINRFREASSFSYEHSIRVGELAGKLAQKVESSNLPGMMESVSRYYNDLGKFHDIGKYAIPYGILEKPGKLTPDETEMVRSHPVVGENMLSNREEFKDLLPAVRHHHERWDGSGYPDGLKGKEIPLQARIISIADSYDAIISDRPYRKGKTSGEAISELERCSGTQFDPHLVNLFSRMIGEE